MSFVESVRTCFAKYADFNGCASRSEFWWWALFNLVAYIVLSFINSKLGLLFTLATLLPYLAVTARRLHDTDRSGWWQLVALIPLVGWIVVLVWCAQEGRSSRFA
ncbi:MAG TPA: DUF805 domain-containing protein [Oxalicibacterium sp.]|jgi:uncharacterized membrane protein YhaH (DUF805 family)|nr:DUF805 domain-containing protein [Oxalicibacterium sp.]